MTYLQWVEDQKSKGIIGTTPATAYKAGQKSGQIFLKEILTHFSQDILDYVELLDARINE